MRLAGCLLLLACCVHARDVQRACDQSELLQHDIHLLNRPEPAALLASTAEQFPDLNGLMDGIRALLGMTGTGADLFGAVKASVADFTTTAHTIAASLVAEAHSSTVDEMITKVRNGFHTLGQKAAVIQATTSAARGNVTSTLGQIFPASIMTAVNSTLQGLQTGAINFTAAFETAAHSLQGVNSTLVCARTEQALSTFELRATVLVNHATSLTGDDFRQNLAQAISLLPEQIRSTVDDMLQRAQTAYSNLVSTLPNSLQEFSTSVRTGMAAKVCPAFQQSSSPGRHVGAGAALALLLSMALHGL